MRILKRALAIVFVAALALAAIAYLLPREIEVSRTATIAAPPDAIFPHVNSMQATEAWSPWLGRDPETKLVYSGPEEGVGNKMEWSSEHPQVGSGSQTIVESVPDERVVTALDFGPMGKADAFFDLEPAAGGTDVTWAFRTDLGMNPVSRWMGLMMDGWVGGDFETGLARLKALAEGG